MVFYVKTDRILVFVVKKKEKKHDFKFQSENLVFWLFRYFEVPLKFSTPRRTARQKKRTTLNLLNLVTVSKYSTKLVIFKISRWVNDEKWIFGRIWRICSHFHSSSIFQNR